MPAITEALDVIAGRSAWCVIHADNGDVLPLLAAVDHVITDPPYSAHVHASVRSSMRDARGVVDLGFAPIDDDTIARVARECRRLARRWTAIFSDVESTHLWRAALGDTYVRTVAWIRVGGAPQFSGDRPAAGFECVTLAHARGRKRWNGGGKAGVYRHAVARGARIHSAQKPLALMLDLVDDFTDAGDVILDPFCGSGTTGVAAVRRGRRFVGVESDAAHAETARQRIAAECDGSDLASARAGQCTLFRGGP